MRTTVHQARRATVHLLLGFGLAFGSYLFITVLLIAAVGTIAVVGAGALPETVTMVRGFAIAKRRQVSEWTGREIPMAYLPITGRLGEKVRTVRRDPSSLGDLRWMFAHYGYGLLFLLTVPLWLVGAVVDGVRTGLLHRNAVVLPMITSLADLDARWSTRLLSPTPKALLMARVDALAETRAGAVAEHSAELRRIERDLHDGAQARLVALSMRIGLAKRIHATDPTATLALLDAAQGEIDSALSELRSVVRSIYPPILADRGLAGALSALVAGSALDVRLDLGDLADGPRAPVAVEAAAYFVVAEAMTNVSRHSGASDVVIRLHREDSRLRIVISDSGHGGAVMREPSSSESSYVAGGSGLLGMRRRVAALDGTLSIDSPDGGPTSIIVELPCAW